MHRRQRTMENKAFDGLAFDAGCFAMLILADSGNSTNVPARGFLRRKDRAGTKCITAVQRQAVIEDMQYAGHVTLIGEKY